MRFDSALPSWLLALLPALVAVVAILAYRRAGGLAAWQRGLLIALRAAVLGAVVWCLLKPVVARPVDRRDGVVVVLVDASRSMGLRDAAGLSRIERAGLVLSRELLPALQRRWRVETLLFGDRLVPARDAALTATADRTNIPDAIDTAVARYRGRGLAGLVVVSDGGDTTGADLAQVGERAGVPVVTVGVGRRDAGDRAVLSLVSGQSSLDASLVDLSVTVASHGMPGPIDLRLLQDGRVVEKRPLTVLNGDTSARAVFTVAPDRQAASVFTVDIAESNAELTGGNNSASVLVAPPGRRRRVLMLEGAPGFEHTFVKRAWMEDPSLDVDSVVRKGRNEQGTDTFFVQAGGDRTTALIAGFPQTREALFGYDAVVLANYDAHLLTGAQLDLLRTFVSERGGGLLVFGARSFDARSVSGSALEDLLPLRIGDGAAAGVLPAAVTSGGQVNRVRPTSEGQRHPVMRIAAGDEESSRRWAALPPLAGYVRLAAPRPGATVLATTESVGSPLLPVVAVQRFGAGRTMVFTGEASWRWKMQMPATDQSYDRFWRQAARWLSADALDPIVVTMPAGGAAGEDVDVPIVVRDAGFRASPGADLQVTLDAPDGHVSAVTPTLIDSARGQFAAHVRPSENGVYRLRVESGIAGSRAHSELRWLVGGRDRELADPRLNEAGLRRLADASGGRYVVAEEAGRAADSIAGRLGAARELEWRPAWHSGWVFACIIVILSGEWYLRRRWGLR